jgi:hypothetical protein
MEIVISEQVISLVSKAFIFLCVIFILFLIHMMILERRKYKWKRRKKVRNNLGYYEWVDSKTKARKKHR